MAKGAHTAVSSAWFPRTVLLCLNLYVIAGGLLSLIGWIADRHRLAHWNDSGICIQPNAALAAASAGIALAVLNHGSRRLAAALGLFVALLGGSAAFQHLSGLDLGIDTLLTFNRTWAHAGVLSPGLMGPPAAACWTLIGVALVLAALPARRRIRGLAPVLALVTAGISGLILIGYLYGASLLFTLPGLAILALQTATFILAISVGLTMSVPEHGPMRLLSEDSPGGLLVRRVAPTVILLPILLGFLRVLGERAGYYDGPFGSALRTTVEIVFFMALLWWTGRALNRHAQERADSERALRASERRVVDMLEAMTDAFVTLDADFRFTYVNSEAERLLGRKRHELLGNLAWEMLPGSISSRASRELHRAASERVHVSFEEFNPILERWFASKVYPAPDGTIAMHFEDITARRHGEEELALRRLQLEAELSDSKLLQEVSTEMIVQADAQRFHETIVDAAIRIMRADFASMQTLHTEPGGAAELRLLAHRGLDPERAALWKRVHGDNNCSCGAALRIGQRVIVRDVTECDFMAGTVDLAAARDLGIRASQTTPLVSRAGTVVGMLSTHWRVPHEPTEREFRLLDILARQAADLIERGQSERQREEILVKEQAARSEAERVARMKDEFLATLSHELRTPLNAIIGWAQVLKTDLLDPKRARSAVEVIERNGRLQAQLITDLLDTSRILSGNMVLDMQAVHLPAVIEAAIESMMPAAEARGVRIETSFERIPEPVRGDPARLQQVVWNLVANAVKFTPRGGRVQVVLARGDSHVEIRVIDNGEGIDPEFLPHIFERFRQADASPSRVHGGLGLGLAIVKEFVDLHGGRVRAGSEGRGKGSTFVIQLPFERTAEDTLQPWSLIPRPPSEAALALPDSLKGIRVLVVDDELDALAMLRRLLEESAAHVETAASAEAALSLIAGEEEFDIIVSDIGMPARDGYELMRDIRAQGITTPAIALTAFARPEDRATALTVGYQAYLAKPVETSVLLAAVASLSTPRAGLSPAC